MFPHWKSVHCRTRRASGHRNRRGVDMLRVFSSIAIVMLLAASPGIAQERPAKEKPSPEKEAAAKLMNEAAATAARVAAEGAQPVNVRIELTITDQRGEGSPVTKTVSMLASDRSWSR